MFSQLMDSDNDEHPDLWMFGLRPDEPPSGMLYDLDQDTPKSFQQQYTVNPAAGTTWDFEFGVQQYPLPRTFYDTDNDGHTDLILTDVDHDYWADLTLTKRGNRLSIFPVSEDHWKLVLGLE